MNDNIEAYNTPGTATAVIVDGEVVAWFKEFTEEAREYCTENHYGKWLLVNADPPTPLFPTNQSEENIEFFQQWADFIKLLEEQES